MSKCGARWHQYECVRPTGHYGSHATEKNSTTWTDEFTTRTADEAAHPETGVQLEQPAQFDNANHCTRCGHVLLNCRCDGVSVARLKAIAAGRLVTDADDARSMARELLAVHAERTNEAHRAQLSEAHQRIARSLATQFATKVFEVQLVGVANIFHGNNVSSTMSKFFNDLAANAVAGLTDLIARETEQ